MSSTSPILKKVFKEAAMALTITTIGAIAGGITGATTRYLTHGSILLGAIEGFTVGATAATGSYSTETAIRAYIEKRGKDPFHAAAPSMIVSNSIGTLLFGLTGAFLVFKGLPPDKGAVVMGGAAMAGSTPASVAALTRRLSHFTLQ